MQLCRIALICLIAATALAACGRRGSLQLPPETKAQDRTPAAAQEQEPVRRPFQKKDVPERPFILDGLI